VGDFKDGKNLFKAGATVDEAAFSEKQTHGIVKYWNIELKDKTPAWAAKKTLIPEEQIIKVARAMGKAGSACAVWMGPGVAMTPRGTYASMAVYALNGILGSIETEGGVFQSSSAPGTKFPEIKDIFIDELAKKGSKGKKLDGRGAKDMPAIMGGFDSKKDKDGKVTESAKANVVTNAVADGILKDPAACQIFISTWSNFNFSAPAPSAGTRPWPRYRSLCIWSQCLGDDSVCRYRAAGHLCTDRETLYSSPTWPTCMAIMSIQQQVAKPLWNVKAEETEVMWLLAEKLKAKGFANLYDYYASFEDPETKQKPTNAAEFCEIAAKISSQKAWNGKEKMKGDQISAAGRNSRKRGSTTPRPMPTKRTGASSRPLPKIRVLQ
jgi:anaerobic selenocysteine-containing dehydrogenase